MEFTTIEPNKYVMKNLKYLYCALAIALFLGACSDDSSSTGPEPPPPEQGEVSAEKQFVYNAMNYWYYWQGDVPDLADDRFADDDALREFLMGYSDAEALYDDLQFIDDDFSFFIDDYEEFQDEQDGIFAALGFNFGFIGFENSDRIVGYVQYIIPGSPADDAGLERLDLFTEVDGTPLNTSNFVGILRDDSAHELTLADIESSEDGVSFPETGTVNIASEQVVEDPVYVSTVIDTGDTKIGYMLYNAFRGNYHEALNNAFGDFKSQGIDDLVLDLRYNGGGAVITSQLLSSMISGLGSSSVFAEFDYSQKRSQQSQEVFFLDEVPLQNEDREFETNGQGEFVNTVPINALSLDQVYVLTSSGTASASEALINGLSPYINVTIIGTQSVGKDEGSLTLYDAPAPYLDEDQANPDHKNAIQPIVLKIVNSNGEDYPDGFTPVGEDNISEITVENLQNKPEIGSPDDPLLGRAISLITGEPMSEKSTTAQARDFMHSAKILMDSNDLRPRGKDMYIEPFMMPVESEN